MNQPLRCVHCGAPLIYLVGVTMRQHRPGCGTKLRGVDGLAQVIDLAVRRARGVLTPQGPETWAGGGAA